MDIEKNVKKVLGQIGGRARVVAASKYVQAPEMAILYQQGITIMGENRVDSLLRKKKELSLPVQWHFIGTLQSRKVKEVINEISCLHSLDRLSLAKEINKHRLQPLDCLVQVNVSGEASKQGIKPGELLDFLEALKPYGLIRVTGLMTMASNTEDAGVVSACFNQLARLKEKAVAHGYGQIQELSMGMSNDYLLALKEGATMVRLGSVLFEN